MSEFIPVNTPLLDGNEKKYLNECIETGWISSEGPFVEEFESRFAKLAGRNYAIAVSNGTSAIDCAIEALEFGPADEIIVPAFAIISCISQILRSGATPVFVDCDPSTWNMEVDQVQARISERTKAIMVVHIYGLPTPMNEILSLAEKHKLVVIEDAAEAHGQTYYERPCGSFGDISTFSFYPNKHITTGEGGMILTDDPELAKTCRDLRNLCFSPERRFEHYRLGWNMRMSNLQAAVGLAQLESLPRFIQLKRAMGASYYQGLKDITNITLPVESTDYADNHYWVYPLVVNQDDGRSAKEVMKALNDKGIGTRPFFYPLHKQPVLANYISYPKYRCPNSEYAGMYGFYIPSGLGLKDDEINRVIDKVKLVMGRK